MYQNALSITCKSLSREDQRTKKCSQDLHLDKSSLDLGNVYVADAYCKLKLCLRMRIAHHYMLLLSSLRSIYLPLLGQVAYFDK